MQGTGRTAMSDTALRNRSAHAGTAAFGSNRHQRAMEEDRAQLVGKLHTLEGQLAEAQKYIQSNMKQYVPPFHNSFNLLIGPLAYELG